jgi:hypothetical protein
MKTDVKRIVESQGAPNENDLWLNGATLKKYQNGEWVTISGGGSSDDSGSGGGSQVQSDWAQSDNTKVDYIKNKPEELIIEGKFSNAGYTLESPEFKPNVGQPSIQDIRDAFSQGRTIKLSAINESNSTVSYLFIPSTYAFYNGTLSSITFLTANDDYGFFELGNWESGYGAELG